MTVPAQDDSSSEAVSGSYSAAAPGIEGLLAMVSHPLTWPADYLDDAASLPALPLIFWLTGTFEPEAVLTLGGQTGTAHLAFCQAADRLNLATRCCDTGCAARGVAAFDTARATYSAKRSVQAEPDPDGRDDYDILALNLSGDTARRDSDMARIAHHLTGASALLLYGPGLSEGLIAGVPAPDMNVMVFGRNAPQIALFLAPGAPSPLSELAALPLDSAERRAFDDFLDRQGRMHRLDLMARGAGARPIEATQDIAPPPSRHAQDVERLLAKLVELEEDRIALRRNRPAAAAPDPEPAPLQDAAKNVSMSDRLHDMEAEIAFLQQRRQEDERHLKAMRTSTSWRITAPLRVVVRALRRLRRS